MTYAEFVKRSLTIVGILLACITLWELRGIVMMGFLSAIIAVTLTVPADMLQRRGMRRSQAIVVTILSVITVVVFFALWILPVFTRQLVDLGEEMPDATNDIAQEYNDWYVEQDQVIRDILPQIDADNALNWSGDARSLVKTEDVASFALPILSDVGGFVVATLTNLLAVIVIALFFMLDPVAYIRGLLLLIPQERHERALEVLHELRHAVTSWMNALALSISVTAFLVWLVFGVALQIPNALALGIIAGLFTIVPNIGSIIALIPIAIFTLAQEPHKLPYVLVAYVIIQLLESNVISPIFVKRELSIPAGLLLLFQLASGAIFGFLGVLLAVPMLALIITFVREVYVFDLLGMRDVRVEIKPDDNGVLQLVTERQDGTRTALALSQQIEVGDIPVGDSS